MKKPAAAEETSEKAAAEAEVAFPWGSEARKTYPGNEERRENWRNIMFPSRNIMLPGVAWKKARHCQEATEWQPFQRPMQLLRRKFRPQMRWWMQSFTSLPTKEEPG
jgi:hypothetical protein